MATIGLKVNCSAEEYIVVGKKGGQKTLQSQRSCLFQACEN